MEKKIGPHTTLSIVQNTAGGSTCATPSRPAYAKRSGVGGPTLVFPRPTGIGLIRPLSQLPSRMDGPLPNRMPPPRPSPAPAILCTPSSTPVTKTPPPELESMYLVTLLQNENRVKIFLSPGKESSHTSLKSKAIIEILEERGLYNKKMNASVHKGLTQGVYDKLVVGGSPFSWTHPVSRKKTTFIVKYVTMTNQSRPGGVGVVRPPFPIPISQQVQPPRGRGRPPNPLKLSTTLSRPAGTPKPKTVEVIDIDSDEEDEQEAEEEEEDDEIIDNDKLFILKKTISVSSSDKSKFKPPSTKILSQSQTPLKTNSSNKQNPGAQLKSRRISSTEPLPKVKAIPAKKVERNVSVARGKYFDFPSKSIIPPSKSLSCHYRIPDLKKFNQAHSKGKQLSIEVHPFLGDRFMVFWSNSTVTAPSNRNAGLISKQHPVVGGGRDKRKNLDDSDASDPRKRSKNSNQTTEPKSTTSISARRGQPTPQNKNKSNVLPISTSRSSSARAPPLPLRQRGRALSHSSEEDYSNSESDSSSGSSSSSSDSDFSASDTEFDVVGKRSSKRGAAVGNKKSGNKASRKISLSEEDEPWDLKHELFKPPPKCFIQAQPCRPLRKSGDGRIYFSLTAKVGPAEHYKNEDLFVNWEKYVRTESSLGSYYKTQLIQSLHTIFAIYHMERDQDKLVLSRSVEMISDGTIKIQLQGVDVTSTFMKYINIDTNTHLSCLLSNLLNSHLCPGCPNFPLVTLHPEACLQDGVWTSKRCGIVVFHDANKFITPALASGSQFTSTKQQPIISLCPACKDLKIRLEEETWELIQLSREYKLKMEANKKGGAKRGRGKAVPANKQPLIYGSYKPPSPPPDEKAKIKKGVQVRESLSHLFLDFWKKLGFKEEEFPKETKDIKVDTVTEKDFPEIPPEDEKNPIPGLLPSLPDSIPILENIDFDENGQTMLTFAEIPLNPYDVVQNGNINIQFMNSSMDLPPISSDVIDSLMNSSEDPASLVQVLAGISENPTTKATDGVGNRNSSSLEPNQSENSATTFSSNFQNDHQPYQNQYSYNHDYRHHPPDSSQSLQLHYLPTGMEPHNIIDFEQNLDFNLNDPVESSLMFPTFSLTEL